LDFAGQLGYAEGESLVATARTEVSSAPELSLRKENGVSVVYAGDWLTYTLTYVNDGNENAYDVVITDTLPPLYAQYNGCDISNSTCSFSGDEVVFDLPVVGAQTERRAFVVVRVDDPLPSEAISLVNQAKMVHSSLGTPVNVQDEDLIGTRPDLTVDVTHYPSLFSPGRLMTYTVAFGNEGRMHAKNVVITATLPISTTYVGYGWNLVSGRVYTFGVGDLPAGFTGSTIVLAVEHVEVDDTTLLGAPVLTMPFTIAENGSGHTDAVPHNNVMSTEVGVPDLVVAGFTVEPYPVQPNVPVTFTVVMQNQGAGMAWNPDNDGGFFVDVFPDYVPSYPSERYGMCFASPHPVAPGDQQTMTIPFDGFTADQLREMEAFYVRVDNYDHSRPYGLVPEYDEGNNVEKLVLRPYHVYLPLVER
jgi:uncharacterized repeat protein (TIGR01451 family)